MNRFCGLICKHNFPIGDVLKKESLRFKKEIIKEHVYLWSDQAIGEASSVFNGLIFRKNIIETSSVIQTSILEAPQELSGSWAFASVNVSKFQITLSRDRIGSRTLFYINTDAFFAFATDIKLLISYGFLKPQLNRKVVFDYFARSEFDALGEKLFDGLSELEPGYQLKYNLKGNNFELKPYVKPSFNRNRERFDMEKSEHYQIQIKEELDRLFDTLFQRKEINASLLSGGLDSSLIALYTSEARSDWSYFTAGFDGRKIDESQEAKQLVDQLGIHNWNVVKPNSSGFIDALKDLAKTIELPTFSTGTYVQYALMQKISESGITEILDGTGADALFAGHHYHYAFLWKELIRGFQFKSLFSEQSKTDLISNPYSYLIKNDIKYNRLPLLSAKNQWRQKLRLYPELKFLKRDLIEDYKANLVDQEFTKSSALNELLFKEYYQGGVRKLLRYVNRCG